MKGEIEGLIVQIGLIKKTSKNTYSSKGNSSFIVQNSIVVS
jgi:hypothetical protein